MNMNAKIQKHHQIKLIPRLSKIMPHDQIIFMLGMQRHCKIGKFIYVTHINKGARP